MVAKQTAKLSQAQSGKIFVAYSYKLYKKAPFRKLFKALEGKFGVTFIFADEEIKNTHILAKISSYISDADFCLFDISDWNPNVTMELGIAYGTNRDHYILFNPTKAHHSDAPSDIRGIDRLQWKSYEDLDAQLTAILSSRYEQSRTGDLDKQFAGYKARLLDLLAETPDLSMGQIADALGVDVSIAQYVTRPLVESGRVKTKGNGRGLRYHV